MTSPAIPLTALALVLAVTDPCYSAKPIHNYTAWTDTAGNPISCHDGGITRVGNTFYWYGTSYKGNPAGLWGRKAAHLQQGFNCYSSKNLVDWKCEGVCFTFPKDGWLSRGTSHRPNVLFCDKTMCDQWFRGPKGERVPIDESCQLWLPVSFNPAIGVGKMLHVQEWDPWK